MGLREVHPAETEVNPAPKWRYDKQPEGGQWVNWAFFMDGDLTLEDCRGWEICCGSVWVNVYDLVVPPDPHPGWPSLAKAPNGLPVFARRITSL